MKERSLSAAEIAKAAQMRGDGNSWRSIGEHFGVHGQTIRRAVDPDYGARRNAWHRRDREIRAVVRLNQADSSEAERQIAEVLPDTRDLTARLCGDPIFERSALYRKSA